MEAKDVFTLYRIAFRADTKSCPVECEHLCDMWLYTLEISAALRSVREIAPTSPFCCVNEALFGMVFVPAKKLSGYRVNLQSQSKLLGHFTVFLPSQCWSKSFVNLPAINNIGRERRQARRKNIAFSGSVQTIFVEDCSLRNARKNAR